MAQVLQVRHAGDVGADNANRVTGGGGVASLLRVQAGGVGADGGKRGQLPGALAGGPLPEGIAAVGAGAGPAQGGVALIPEWPPAAGAHGEQIGGVAQTDGDRRQSPGQLPDPGLGEAGWTDLSAVPGNPPPRGDGPEAGEGRRVESGEVEDGAVVGGQRRGRHLSGFQKRHAGESANRGPGRVQQEEPGCAGTAASAYHCEELGGGDAVGLGEVLEVAVQGLAWVQVEGDRQWCAHPSLRSVAGPDTARVGAPGAAKDASSVSVSESGSVSSNMACS